MAAPLTKTPEERELHLTRVWELYTSGKNFADIGRALGVTRGQIRYDIISLRTTWHKENMANITLYTEQELAKLDHIENEAWDAYYRSIGKKKHVFRKKGTITDEDGTPLTELALLEEKEKTWNEAGDPRFLQIALQASQDRRQLLGLDAPKRQVNLNINEVRQTKYVAIEGFEGWEVVSDPEDSGS